MSTRLAGFPRALLTALLLVVALTAQPAAAAEIEVETTNDELDADAECSLREAVQAANDNAAVSGCDAGDPGEDIIVVEAVPFSVPSAHELDGDDNEDANADGDLDISESVVIDGVPFASFGDVIKPRIDGLDHDRAIDIIDGAGPVSVTLDELELVDGRARDQNGGAIRSDETDSSLTLTQTDVLRSRTNRDGGAIHIRGELTIDRGTFRSNTATGDGGAIESHGPLSLQGDTTPGAPAEFAENAALGNGGAVAAFGATESLDASFAANSGDRGGAIANDTDPLTIDGGSFTTNEADGPGGAVESDGDASIAEALFEGNKGLSGGAISTDADASTSIEDSLLSENRATVGVGGAIETGLITADNTDFEGNLGVYGGGIFTREGGQVTDSGLTANVATGVEGPSGTPGLGGAIYSDDGGSLLIEFSTIEGNTAGLKIKQGSGAVYQSMGDLTVRSTTVRRNRAVEAVLTVLDGSLTLENSTVADNRTGRSATVLVGSDLVTPSTISHSTIAGNITTNRAASGPAGITGGVSADGPFTLERSILAFNSLRLRKKIVASNCAFPDQITSGGYNLESHNTCGLLPGAPDFDLINTNPLLAAVAYNGGSTNTMGLYDTSPAIDAVPACPPPATDQRDDPRPTGTQCEIGAFEGSLGAPTEACKGVAATIVGTQGGDVIVGTPSADVIVGLNGNDTILGARGNDRICGGHGRDDLRGGPGRNRIFQ